MRIATLLFTYNRSWHTEQVISALAHNTNLPQKLFVFQDGLKKQEDLEEWKKVNSLIDRIDWCEKEIIVSEYNKGLAASILSGIYYAFQEYEAVIVLEDDCVPAPNFLLFMQLCFEKYRDNKKVYSVSGYGWPMDLERTGYDIYGCGRASSWGWGTWKDRWEKYHRDNDILRRLKEDRLKSLNLAAWGMDCEKLLVGNITGTINSWAIYWTLNIIEDGGICINPYDSLIQNIGFDGTGVHCGKTSKYEVEISNSLKKEFKLPDEVVICDSTKKAFAKLSGSYTAVNNRYPGKERVLVYGLGNFYLQNEEDINEKYNIEAFVDKRKHGWFAGIKIISLHEVSQYAYDKIIIMVYNMKECFDIVHEMVTQYGVDYNKIYLGNEFYGNISKEFDSIKVTADGKLRFAQSDIAVSVSSLEEYNIMTEVFIDKVYFYFLNSRRKDIVIDVGMKTGISTLFFLKSSNVEKVYSFETYGKKFIAAEENLKEYLGSGERLEIFPFGISSQNGQINQVEVRDAVEIFNSIIGRYLNYNLILKLDCEDSGQKIMKELEVENLLEKFAYIIVKWHGENKEEIITYLDAAGFSYLCNNTGSDIGFLYAYRTSDSC